MARAKKGKAASSAALNIHLLRILTWNDALWRGAWPLLYDSALRVRDVLPLLYDVLRFVGS